MFLIRFLRWLLGWVRLEAEGGFPERLLNLAAREGIDLWGVKRRNVTLAACCPVRQYHRLRSPAHRAGMRMHVEERHGAPFLIRRYRARAGLAIGLALFFIILQLFSQRIWVVEVRGNKEVEQEKILEVMEHYGVREGANLSSLDIAELQLNTLKELPDLAWCVVNLQGSIAYIDVTERVPTPKLSNIDLPSNIKAARDGRIVSVEVYTGQSMVKKGDAVAQGMLLVSGVVETSVGPILRRSQACILAQTTHHIEVRIPLKETCMLPSGRTIIRPSLHLFTLNIPCFTDGPIDEENTLTVIKRPINVNGINLPVGMISQHYELLQQTEIERTEQQAAKLAAEKLEEKVKNELSEAQIKNVTEKGELQDGCYVLTRKYTCIENICKEEQIILDEPSS